jgi:hypothetical protein
MRSVAVFGGLAALVLSVALIPSVAYARRAGIAAPGCDGCHRGGKAPTVTLTANPLSPAVGAPTTLTVSITATNGNVGGFYLTTEGTNNGAFRALESGTLANKDGVTHTMPRTASGGTVTFKAEWTASAVTGVDFIVYALSGNGDGSTNGDGGEGARLTTVAGCTGTTYYVDQDSDGYGTSDPVYPPHKDCSKPVSYADKMGDCDDFTASVHPGASESCDGKDNDCNGKVDDQVVYSTYCTDKDGDGHGTKTGATKMDCAPSAGFGDCNGDCNDNDKTIYPGAGEVCDGYDNNCDGKIDEGVRLICGKGWCARYAEGCTTMCTPGPPMVETCNYFDDDCDGVADNGTDLQLCGRAGLACVLGQCIEDGPGGTGGMGSMADGGTGSGSGGRGAGSGGAGASPGGASGGGGAAAAGGGAGAPPEGPGCSGCALTGAASAQDVGGLAGLGILGALLGVAASRRRSDPLSATRPPR